MDVKFIVGLVIFAAVAVVIVKVRKRKQRDTSKLDRGPHQNDPEMLEKLRAKLREIFKGERLP